MVMEISILKAIHRHLDPQTSCQGSATGEAVMSVFKEPVKPGIDQPARLTLWSFLMLPAFVVVFLITSVVGEYVVLDILGLDEGDLFLMQGGVAGWLAEVVFALLLVSAPAGGVWLAARALRHGGKGKSWAGLILNGLLVLLVVYMFVDAIRMSYFAPLD